MFRFVRQSGPMTRSRRRNHQLTCEALETRQLLSGFYIANAASGLVLTDPAIINESSGKMCAEVVNKSSGKVFAEVVNEI